MNRIILVTRPHYDDATAYLSYYASLLIKEADKLNIVSKDFSGEKVTKKNILKFMEKRNPKFVFVNGHGNSHCIEGDKDEIIFSTDTDMELLKNKLFYGRACHAGLFFGKEMVKGNKGCFIGYQTPFSFWSDGRYSAVPAKDMLAKLFLEPSNKVVKSLLKGNSAKIAHEKSKDAMVENMKRILTMEENKEPGATGWLGVLWNNYDGQVLHGNKEMRF